MESIKNFYNDYQPYFIIAAFTVFMFAGLATMTGTNIGSLRLLF